MPATGPSSRRSFLALCAVWLHAEEDPPTLKLLTNLAAKLSDHNLPGVLESFAKSMPGYEDVVANLGALTSQYDVICAIEILDESGDDRRRKAETEWFLQMKSQQENGPTERRTVKVRLTTERIKNKWQIIAMEPLTLLAPPQIR